MATSSSIDPSDVAQFSALAEEWWDEAGPFAPLHKLNPARLTFIRDQLAPLASQPAGSIKPLKGLKVLDAGCGGGLVSEPVARMGAQVTGLDASQENIATARVHAHQMGLDIDYRAGAPEDLPESLSESFDGVLALEVVEHVADVPGFLASCARLVRPGGVLILSTLNKTARSFIEGIVGAEYVLGWVPRGTHNWRQFQTPQKMEDILNDLDVAPWASAGLSLDVMNRGWKLSEDLSVNYMIAGRKKG